MKASDDIEVQPPATDNDARRGSLSTSRPAQATAGSEAKDGSRNTFRMATA